MSIRHIMVRLTVPSNSIVSTAQSGTTMDAANNRSRRYTSFTTTLSDDVIHGLVLECERIVMIEFMECAVPVFYAIYVLILFHLLNAAFYPEMA